MDKQTPIFKALTDHARGFIDHEIEKGAVDKQKSRWDEKDQVEFEKIPIKKLLDDPYYGGGDELWEPHKRDLIELWERRKKHGVNTFVDIEGIGSGKTHKFRHAMRLLMLEVITKVDPLAYYNLDPKGQGISFVCMSRNAQLAKEVTFKTVLKVFDCPFFNTYFPPQVDLAQIEVSKRYPSLLRFPKDIVIFPGTGSALSAVGYNLFGGGVDEANYLEVVDSSKKAFVGKFYDAAELMYNAIMARILSRNLPGLLMMFSNPRYEGDFLERMALRAKRDSTIFVRRRCTWEAQPSVNNDGTTRFCGDTFNFDVYNRKIVESG